MLYKALFGFALATLLILSGLACFITYEQTLEWLSTQYTFDKSQWQKLTTQILTKEHFYYIKLTTILLLCLLGILYTVAYQKINQIQTLWHSLSEEFLAEITNFTTTFQKLSRLQYFALIAFLMLSFSYDITSLYRNIIHIDEAFSFVHFASKGFWVSALYYPNPNNHILFNVWVSLWQGAFSNKLWAIRLPSIISEFFLQILLLQFFLQRNIFKNALSLVAIFSLLSCVQAYSVSGRGYLMLTLWVWITGNTLTKILKNYLHEKQTPLLQKVIFITACWAGFYTIPLYVYYFVSILISALIMYLPKKIHIYKSLFILVSVSILGTALLYLPVFILNGWQNMLALSWQKEAQEAFQKHFWQYWIDFGDFWLGIEGTWKVSLPIMIILAGSLLYKNSSSEAYFWALVMLNCLLIMLLQQKFLPVRTWIPLSICLVMLTENFINTFEKNIARMFISCTLLLLIISQMYQNYNYSSTHQTYIDAFQQIQKLPFQNSEKVFSNDLIYQNLIAFYNLQNRWQLKVDYSFKETQYDWIILDKNSTAEINLQNYYLYHQTKWVSIFKGRKP